MKARIGSKKGMSRTTGSRLSLALLSLTLLLLAAALIYALTDPSTTARDALPDTAGKTAVAPVTVAAMPVASPAFAAVWPYVLTDVR